MDCLSQKVTKARIAHRCDECFEVIEPKQVYRKSVFSDCGELVTTKLCLECACLWDTAFALKLVTEQDTELMCGCSLKEWLADEYENVVKAAALLSRPKPESEDEDG